MHSLYSPVEGEFELMRYELVCYLFGAYTPMSKILDLCCRIRNKNVEIFEILTFFNISSEKGKNCGAVLKSFLRDHTEFIPVGSRKKLLKSGSPDFAFERRNLTKFCKTKLCNKPISPTACRRRLKGRTTHYYI